MTRVGFQVRDMVRPPFVQRWTESGAVVNTTHYAEQCHAITPMVILDRPGGGATRCIEEITQSTRKLLSGNLVVLVSDLTKRSEWGLLEFLINLRNCAVSSISTADPTNLPDYNFRGFDYLAVLYWCVELNCEGPEPAFVESPYLKKYKKLQKPLKTIATSGISELLDFGGVIFDLVTSTVEESIEERVSKNLKKLARYRLPLGSAHAESIRKRISEGAHITRFELFNALSDEIEDGFGKTFKKNSGIKVLSVSDAIDILEVGKVTRAGRDFSRGLERTLKSLSSHKNTISVAGGRDVYEPHATELPGMLWKICRLRGVTPEEILPNLGGVISPECKKKLHELILDPDENNLADLTRYAEIWELIQRGESFELT